MLFFAVVAKAKNPIFQKMPVLYPWQHFVNLVFVTWGIWLRRPFKHYDPPLEVPPLEIPVKKRDQRTHQRVSNYSKL